MIRCSVVIPTSDRPALLTRVLDAVANQDFPPDEYEIVVCGDGACDQTRALVDRWRDTHVVPVTYLPVTTPNLRPAGILNAGVRAARGEVLAFTDETAVPEPDWVRHGWLALTDGAADAASSRTIVPVSDVPASDEPDITVLERAGFVATNCFCRRAAFEAVGGFDTCARAARREDHNLHAKLTRSGFDVVYALDAVTLRPVPATPPGPRSHSRRPYSANDAYYAGVAELYSQYIASGRPLHRLGALAAVGAAVAALIAATW